jgi:hypothetical protein
MKRNTVNGIAIFKWRWGLLMSIIPVIMASGESAFSTPVCDAIKEKIQDSKSELRARNCERVLHFANLDKEAAQYALGLFHENFGKLADPRCLKAKEFDQNGIVPSKSQVLNGIKNSCSFGLND